MSSDKSACLDDYFSNVPADRVKDVEVGTTGVLPLIGPSQPWDEIVALRFTEFNQAIGAMKFLLFPENYIFKVISVVGANCQEIESFSNVDGGDKRVLDSYGGLRIRFGDHEYALTLIYDPAGGIYLGHFQSVDTP